ncbi:MAG: DnaJ domain-containing protein, partial [Sphingomicrobium sp.]
MTPDHYATLGVSPTAKSAVIRAAYLALMREYHPDRNPDPVAVERAQAIIAAYKVLGDFDQRDHYDWDRRREREAAAAAAAKRPRRIRAGELGAGAIGLAAVSVWMVMPTPTREPVITKPEAAEARVLPVAKARPKPEVKQVAVAAPAKVKVDKRDPVAKVERVEPRAEPVRVAKAEPVRVAKVEPVRVAVQAKPTVERVAVVRLAAVKPPAPRAEPKSPPAPIRSAARSAPPAA